VLLVTEYLFYDQLASGITIGSLTGFRTTIAEREEVEVYRME